MPTEPDSPVNKRGNGGGAATAAGITFQQHVGALVASWMLTGSALDRSLELGNAHPTWLRFETEAPTDDILVATSEGGFLAYQVKTTLSSSSEPGTPFAKTVDQLVRHWQACRDGDGSMEWNRRLDPSKDRLVIAVGPMASASIRVHLPSALRLVSSAGGGLMTVKQEAAFAHFEACVLHSWSRTTSDAFPDQLIVQLAALISVVTIDPSEKELVAGLASLAGHVRALAIAGILESYCGELMSKRGGFDEISLRRALITRGAPLPSAPAFYSDIERLKAHSATVRRQLESYERIKSGSGEAIAIRRDCQNEVEAAAQSGSLLVIGEPGAGKSGVLNSLARHLVSKGMDVLELAVDQFSVETLQGLSSELGLSHPVLDVLEAWDGVNPAWLIVDALDATRGGRGEGVFRTLIERVVAMNSRWHVVASIRTFDLRMGRRFREIFKGQPPLKSLSEPGFGAVRHIRVPPWSQGELDELLQRAPLMKTLLGPASSRLRELATIPFNTRLMGELLEDGVLRTDISEVETQAQLLAVYWEHRVATHGYEAEGCLRRVINLMLESRALRASKSDLIDSCANALQVLVGEGVLVTTDSDRWIQFRHHLLFDYVASRLYLRPRLAMAGADASDGKFEGLGLMLAPALSFFLQDLWMEEDDHREYWNVVVRLASDVEADPVLRSVASRMPAELAATGADVAAFTEMLLLPNHSSGVAVQHFVGALAVRLDDKEDVPAEPWIAICLALAERLDELARVARVLCGHFVNRVDSNNGLAEIGHVARQLLAYALDTQSNDYLLESAIGLVVDTFETNSSESRRLLSRLFETSHFESVGWSSVPALARKIELLARCDPEFASFVYQQTYEKSVIEDRATNLGHSQILPLRSNARQDYELARYALAEFFPSFLRASPTFAARSLSSALNGYIAREHARSSGPTVYVTNVLGHRVHLQADYSHIWAHDPDGGYAQDADSLVAKFLMFLRKDPEPQIMEAAREVLRVNSMGLLWARMFMAAAERKGTLADLLWPYATNEAFILASETRKDAVDLIAAVYGDRELEDRVTFERAAMAFDFSRFGDSELAKKAVLGRLFSSIGSVALLTDEAKQLAEARPTADGEESNARLFSTRATWAAPSPYHWLENFEANVPDNSSLISLIDSLKSTFRLDRSEARSLAVDLEEGLALLRSALTSIEDSTHAHEGLKRHAQGVVGEAVAKLAAEALSATSEDLQVLELLQLLDGVASSPYPELDEDTESRFAESASWGSPAPRVDAAIATFDFLKARPEFYEQLRPLIDRLLADQHPAVRLQAIGHLTQLWDVDRKGMWVRLEQRTNLELNPTVVSQGICDVLARVMNADSARTEELTLQLYWRFGGDTKSDIKIRGAVSHILTHIWVGYDQPRAGAAIKRWIEAPETYRKEIRSALTELRQIYVYGLHGKEEKNATEVRHRAQTLIHDVVAHLHALITDSVAKPSGDTDTEETGRYFRLVDCACMQLYFAVESLGEDGGNPGSLETLLFEVGPTLKLIGDIGTPHTIYYLLQLLEKFIPFDPGAAFDLIANSLLRGGERFGYQYESMGTDLVVRLVGIYLADNKEIFEDTGRRRALVECLEVFMQAGWPSARRLLYSLPELVQ